MSSGVSDRIGCALTVYAAGIGERVNLWWSWVLATIGCVGIYLAGRQNKWGWFLGVCAQVVWMSYGIVTAQYGFCVTAVVYGFLQGKNFLMWHRAGQTQDAEASA